MISLCWSIEATSDIDKKETLYAEIDKLNDESYVITEKVSESYSGAEKLIESVIELTGNTK